MGSLIIPRIGIRCDTNAIALWLTCPRFKAEEAVCEWKEIYFKAAFEKSLRKIRFQMKRRGRDCIFNEGKDKNCLSREYKCKL